MIINSKTIESTGAGSELILRSPLKEDAQNFLDHLITTHSESAEFLEGEADLYEKIPLIKEEEILEATSVAKNRFFICAFLEGRIIGGMGFFGDHRPFRSHSATVGMSIQKEFHNQGIGRALLEYGISEAPRAGLSRLDLTVRSHNLAAIHLYEKLGFKKVGKLHRATCIKGKYIDDYLYEKVLISN